MKTNKRLLALIPELLKKTSAPPAKPKPVLYEPKDYARGAYVWVNEHSVRGHWRRRAR